MKNRTLDLTVLDTKKDPPEPPAQPAESRPPTVIVPPEPRPLAGLDKTAEPRRPHVLVVDDDQDVAYCLRLALARKGFEVSVALTASAAQEFCKRRLPDVILLDVDLPDLSGLELCCQLKAEPRTSQMPIVFCSGNEDARAQALQLGAADFFEKPPDLTQLAQRLHALLAHPPAAKTTETKA